MNISINNINELTKVSEAILEQHPNVKVFLFNGAMGAGKTTLIKVLCEKLGVTENVQSPTFSLVNEYDSPNGTIYHFDFYRLETTEQAFEIGAEDYFFSNSYCFIEWPNLITNLLPPTNKYITIDIFVNENQRTFQF